MKYCEFSRCLAAAAAELITLKLLQVASVSPPRRPAHLPRHERITLPLQHVVIHELLNSQQAINTNISEEGCIGRPLQASGSRCRITGGHRCQSSSLHYSTHLKSMRHLKNISLFFVFLGKFSDLVPAQQPHNAWEKHVEDMKTLDLCVCLWHAC